MKKRKKIVTSIGHTLILVTCIIIVISLIHNFNNEALDPIDKGIIALYCFFFVFPIILEEMLLLGSVYNLTCFSSRISAKICNIISITILCAALIFQLLVFAGVITPNMLPEGPRDDGSRLMMLVLWTEWPVIFLSSILGSGTCSSKENSL